MHFFLPVVLLLPSTSAFRFPHPADVIINAFKNVVDCDSCHALLVPLKALAEGGDPVFVKTLILTCKILKVWSLTVSMTKLCDGNFGLCQSPAINEYTIPMGQAGSLRNRVLSTGKTPFQVVHFSDVHIDRERARIRTARNPSVVATLRMKSGLRIQLVDFNTGSEPGEVNAQRNLGPPHVEYLTGDIVEAAVWFVNRSEVNSDIDMFNRELAVELNAPVFPAIGNQSVVFDAAPVNNFPLNATLGFDAQWVFDLEGKQWASAESRCSFSRVLQSKSGYSGELAVLWSNGSTLEYSGLQAVPRLFESKTPTFRPGTPVVVPPKMRALPTLVQKAPANENGNGAPAKTFEAAILGSMNTIPVVLQRPEYPMRDSKFAVRGGSRLTSIIDTLDGRVITGTDGAQNSLTLACYFQPTSHCQRRKEDTDTLNGMRGRSLNLCASRSSSGFTTVVGSCGAMSVRRSMENPRITITSSAGACGYTENAVILRTEVDGFWFDSLGSATHSGANKPRVMAQLNRQGYHLDHPAWTAPDAGGRSVGPGLFLCSHSRGTTNNYLVQLPPPSPALSRRTTSWWNINQFAPDFLRKSLASDAESDCNGEMPAFPSTSASMFPASPASLSSTSASLTPRSSAPPSRSVARSGRNLNSRSGSAMVPRLPQAPRVAARLCGSNTPGSPSDPWCCFPLVLRLGVFVHLLFMGRLSLFL
ncbi:hypothetical protein C8R44DRAFT_734117 [Mycena epipterygia]|nr:hypothetical protein C8R44DRAFT_734117 [Mycena epipterygia]